ncbi:hypothetical protein BO79DRAFT_269059 [Aspergillus costaricaensis CBS 115574]|uniref:Uncharacterized protein n=1 Tax=Aspergillus costaricaensis CBS 115574 TaxID=1448317 RepID=A0ACD1IC32_9EURO|nr:hypothetical protein BO79DRAFT_269059 [Aspergillus costaricaensis CBS 115574]RAK87298.1 hypothetical protein BO79DRAFT_269059 [Aspergillus costaricaensis CBS 115574]
MPPTTAPHPDQRGIEPHPDLPHNSAHEVDYTPHPENSVPLPPSRQSIQDHIIALYCGSASAEDMSVYAEQAVYDDPFSYCDTRYKIAGQWYGIPKLFSKSENLGTEVVLNTDDEMVWKQRQRYTFRGIGASRTEDSLVSLRLQGGEDGERVVYHKDMWSEKDYDHQGFGALMKKVNGDKLTGITRPPEEL